MYVKVFFRAQKNVDFCLAASPGLVVIQLCAVCAGEEMAATARVGA